MKYLDFCSLLDGDPAHIAFLSTFQFDPDFFERRLLRCPALTKARRVVVFLDGRQWFELLRRDVPAPWLNRRYLVVPVQRPQGAFHPKLSLLLTEAGGRVLCGSNNLTRSGCSSNLELLNSVPFDFDSDCPEGMVVAREAFAFFQQASKHADNEITRIATEWIDETARAFPWLREPVQVSDRSVRLLHTYDGGIWDRLVEHLKGVKPKEFFIASPFHDADAGLGRRLATQWPQAQLEFLVQQGYTNLIVKPLKNLRRIRLSEVRDSSRRIHAKLLAWRSQGRGGCLVGSANFTSAALDGRNVEACLLISSADELVESLFDRSLSKHPLALDEFVPGEAESPEAEWRIPSLHINSALLTDANQIRISYSHKLDPPPDSLRLTIRTPGQPRPFASINLSKTCKSTHTVILPDSAVADTHGALLASLVADIGGEKVESLPVWVIQESRLTYEPGEGSSSSKGKIEDTGEGLPEYLDELGKRDGISAVVEYLQHLNIRFADGGGAGIGQRKFRLKIRDPFHADNAPSWLIEAKVKTANLERAIYEFVERHEKRRLHKHVSRGNINGMENFLDIMASLVRLLYVYYKRGVVIKDKLILQLRTFVELATIGRAAFGENAQKDSFNGYLRAICDNIDGDAELLQNVCNETHYLAEVRAILLIVQTVRFDPKQDIWATPKATRPREVLRYYANAVSAAIIECGLREPKPKDVKNALESYRMFSDQEIARHLAELPVE